MLRLLELNASNIDIYLEQLLAIEQEAFAEPWTRADYLEEAARPIAHILALVNEKGAEDEPLLLAYAGFWQVLDEADINNVAVAAAQRGRGYGRQLLQAVLARALNLGCKRLTLEVRPSNAPALALYQSLGFVVCGRRSGYYQDNGEDALLMECVLAE
jgi:ribosomal-protein-alanine N-acetyltransferase